MAPHSQSHLFHETNELEITISLIKVCSVQWKKMPLKLLACFIVSKADGANASRTPSAATKLQDRGFSRKTRCLQQQHQVRVLQSVLGTALIQASSSRTNLSDWLI